MKEIIEDITYIGVNDKDIKLFEGQYDVPNGMSYNSYIIKDDKIVLLDTVDKRATDTWMINLEEALDGKLIDYLVISHLEPDHSGSIQTLTQKYPNVTLVGNEKTFQMLDQFFSINSNIKRLVVKEGNTLNIGKHTLQFFMAPMVHWPEVMVTYEQKEKILFSADGFGKFGSLDAKEDWVDEARRYYIGIVGKYGMQVQNLLKKASELDIKMICPLHGPILKENLDYYINKYDIWSKYEPEEKGILIAYASIHGNTEEVAKKLAEMLKEKNENVVLRDLTIEDMYETVSQAFKYDRMVLLAASYNMSVFPPMEDFLNRLKDRNFQNRKVALIENGSWAPSAGRVMQDIISKMKNIETVGDIITIKSSMKPENIKQMKELVSKLI